MILTITGTQQGATDAQLEVLLRNLLRIKSRGPSAIHHGGCIGVDKQAHWLLGALGLLPKVTVWPSTVYDKQAWLPHADTEGQVWTLKEEMAPLVRNKVMVDLSTHVFALPKEMEETLRSGTWATVRYARKLERRLLIIWPDGEISASRGTGK